MIQSSRPLWQLPACEPLQEAPDSGKDEVQQNTLWFCVSKAGSAVSARRAIHWYCHAKMSRDGCRVYHPPLEEGRGKIPFSFYVLWGSFGWHCFLVRRGENFYWSWRKAVVGRTGGGNPVSITAHWSVTGCHACSCFPVLQGEYWSYLSKPKLGPKSCLG